MRLVIVLYFVSITVFGSSQQTINDTTNTEKNFVFRGYLVGGLNWENNPYQEDVGYGIHLAENNRTLGYFWNFGARVRYRDRFGIGLQTVQRITPRIKDQFSNSLSDLFPDKEVLLRSKLKSISRFGIQLSLSYRLRLKSFFFTPNLGAAITTGELVSYEYVLRTPSTNYFDHYRIYNNGKGEKPLSIGFTLSHDKMKWLELVAEAGMSTVRNRYKIYKLEIDESYGQEPDEIIEFSRDRYYFSVGVVISAELN